MKAKTDYSISRFRAILNAVNGCLEVTLLRWEESRYFVLMSGAVYLSRIVQ
jgi:hypothetical protein